MLELELTESIILENARESIDAMHRLKELGVRGLSRETTSDELDAVTAALVGRWFLKGNGEMLGGDEGILIPKPRLAQRRIRGT